MKASQYVVMIEAVHHLPLCLLCLAIHAENIAPPIQVVYLLSFSNSRSTLECWQARKAPDGPIPPHDLTSRCGPWKNPRCGGGVSGPVLSLSCSKALRSRRGRIWGAVLIFWTLQHWILQHWTLPPQHSKYSLPNQICRTQHPSDRRNARQQYKNSSAFSKGSVPTLCSFPATCYNPEHSDKPGPSEDLAEGPSHTHKKPQKASQPVCGSGPSSAAVCGTTSAAVGFHRTAGCSIGLLLSGQASAHCFSTS
jgi:hypothetical protein